MKKITIIDYGIGNVLSVKRSFEYCGAEVFVTSDPTLIYEAERLVLPGVGAFFDGMKGLNDRGLIEPIKMYAQKNKPFLGICLGMQMMMDIGEEFGEHKGLGLISGNVIKIPRFDINGKEKKIPHIGWNNLFESSNWEGTILKDIDKGETVYFVHSYMVEPLKEENILATCFYNEQKIVSVVKSGNLYGCQFHPEKSGPTGLKIICNFANGLFDVENYNNFK